LRIFKTLSDLKDKATPRQGNLKILICGYIIDDKRYTFDTNDCVLYSKSLGEYTGMIFSNNLSFWCRSRCYDFWHF